MRISDWSSDVCSSDLADPKRLYLDAVRQAFAADGHDPLWFSGPKSAHPDREWHPGLRNDRREHLPHSQAGIDLVRSGSRTAARQAKGRCDCAGRRSEEHTSELQSLMRISYPVFCLKNKIPSLLN